MIRRLLMLVAALSAALSLAVPAAAGRPLAPGAKPGCSSCPGRTYRLAVVTKPGAAQTVLARRFAELVRRASGGHSRVVVYHSGAKGNESQILEQLRAGELDFAVVTNGVFDRYAPQTRVVEFPFLFSSYSQVDRALQGPAGRAVLASLAQAGLKGLAFGENGFRHLTNNLRPVVKAADLKGLRVRVMESELQKELWRRLGAVPVPHPWPITELLARGGVDGQENPLWVIWLYRLDKLQKHLTLTGHVYSAHICAANLAWFQALPRAERAMLAEAMRQAAAYQRAWHRGQEKETLARLKAAGMQVVESPDLASFRARVADLAGSPLFQEPGLEALLKEFRRAARP